MSDLIKREDAIEAIINKLAWHGSDGSYYHSDDIKDALNGLPSADRPQGEWIVRDDNTYCSKCGASEDTFIYGSEYWHGLGLSHYCPNCGVKMKVVKR